MSTDPNAPGQAGEAQIFSRGYYLFFGAVAGFFVVVALAMTVIIGVSFIGDDGGSVAVDTTSPDDGSNEGAGGDPVAGEEVYSSTCAACHGGNGEGVPGLGPSFVGNEFVASLSDEELIAFIEQGRPADDPDNTTGIAMPPKGGNPSLDDEDLADVAAFLRTLE